MRERIGTVIERHLRGNPTVREIARELRISPRHLTGLCPRLFGDSPARLLLGLKLRRAEEMLRYGDRRVKEVSEALGFANPFHFFAVFRRHHGRSPVAAINLNSAVEAPGPRSRERERADSVSTARF